MSVFSIEDGYNRVDARIEFDLFDTSSPTWGEINYYAFRIQLLNFITNFMDLSKQRQQMKIQIIRKKNVLIIILSQKAFQK